MLIEMEKKDKKPVKNKKIKAYLRKKRSKVSLQDSESLNVRIIKNQEAPILLVNMSRSEDIHFNESKTSRIRFENSLTRQNPSSEYSALSIFEKLKEAEKRYSTTTRSLSEDTFDLLDPTSCFHPQCSFAYNLTGDVRRASLVTESIPNETYQRLAEVWGLDPFKAPRPFGNTCRFQNTEEEDKIVEEFIRNVERDLGLRSDISEDLHVNCESLTKDQADQTSKHDVKSNPYLKFLKEGGDLDPELQNKMNLRKKATKITKMIINNFLDWYQSLGGSDGETVINESTLLEFFQIGFEFPAAKAMIIRIREMPTVPDNLAKLMNEPKHATRYGLREYLKQDIIKENIPARMFAFGKMLPKGKPCLRYKPPNNAVRKTWMECSRVPTDLDTMKTIWEGLEGLRSTVAFSNWLKDHPEVKPPTYLQEKGLLQIDYEEWNQIYKGFEFEIDTVEAVSSDTKAGEERFSAEESKTSSTSTKKLDSLDSF